MVNQRPNRRTILKSLSGVAGMTAFGVGSAAASDANISEHELSENAKERRVAAREAKAAYNNPTTAKAAVQEQATDFLRALGKEGFLDSGNVADFDWGELTTWREAFRTGDGVSVDSLPLAEGKFGAEITLHRPTSRGVLEVHVVPDTGRNFAVLDPDDRKGNETSIFETGTGDITTQDLCKTYKKCVIDSNCGGGKDTAYKIRFCRQRGCTYSRFSCCLPSVTHCDKAPCQCI